MRCWYLRPEELSGVEGRDGSMLRRVCSFKDFTCCCPLVCDHLLPSQKQRRIGNERSCITAVIQSYSSFLGLLKQNLGTGNRKSRCQQSWHPSRAVSYLPWLLAASGVPWLGDDIPHLSSYRFPLHMCVYVQVSLFRKDSVISGQGAQPSNVISTQSSAQTLFPSKGPSADTGGQDFMFGWLQGNTIQCMTQSIICSHLWLT